MKKKTKKSKKVETKGNLVPFPAKLAKELGLQFDKKQGMLVDKKKLKDLKGYARPKEEKPEPPPKEPDKKKKVVVEETPETTKANVIQKQREKDLGIY